ncbi:hypothetical protein PILCRDRAFT_15751 [Piloderma croceum F 1598]|uniref:Uncharacterized protein n=1 Tax=Piloderma croceum (strain F 1598) TaxID=765440 RepID=A0A0C3AG80_PILCF|nr:hypothetical protein PILCRDRAFT_15751 [Piloderma croceum F 1598]
MVTGTRYRNEVAVATYFLIEVAAATSHNHAYHAAIASPVIMTLWLAILFTVGIIDYIIETPLGGLQYTLKFALIPIGFGVLAVIAAFMIGWIIGKQVDTQLDDNDLKLILTHGWVALYGPP